MKILHLTLKKRWFDLIELGIKKEEYRSIKKYWTTRFDGKGYTHINFKNGYNKNSPSCLVELKSIRIGIGNRDWGAPDEHVYILELGEIL